MSSGDRGVRGCAGDGSVVPKLPGWRGHWPSWDAGGLGHFPVRQTEKGSESLKKLDVIENPEDGCGG